MAHSLKLKTISEGVETNEQLQVLQALKADFSQGFLHGRPKPAEDAGQLLKRAVVSNHA